VQPGDYQVGNKKPTIDSGAQQSYHGMMRNGATRRASLLYGADLTRKNYMCDRWPRMTKEQINACPIRKYQGRIQLIQESEQVEQAVRELEKETVLGFDTETRPTFRVGQHYPPAVLQLAGEQAVYVFQLKHCRLSKALRRLLVNPKIIKAGVALDRDVQELNKLAPFKPAGFVDVGELAKQAGCRNHGIRGLATQLLGFRVSKNSQTSNWAKKTLTRAQIEYAATDAWVGRELYHKLQELLP